MFAGMGSSDLGQNIHWSFRLGKLRDSRKLETSETALGVIPAVVACLALVWLLGVGIGRMPFVGFSNSVNDSFIVQQLTHALPPVPAVFAEFDRQVNPNAQPYVFTQPKSTVSFNYVAAEVQAAEAKASNSVVRITSFSCGGIVGGSGFVAGKGIVVTNAHVIAGSRRPIVKYRNNSYEGIPVYFDPNGDLAVLRVQGLNASPLALLSGASTPNHTVAVLGYPGSNYRAAPGIIQSASAISTSNIYDQGSFARNIYVVQTDIAPGSSGGPVVLSSGRVAGVIFSKSTDMPDIAYALASSNVEPALRKAEASYVRVSTGACVG